MRYVAVACGLTLAVVFLASAVSKVRNRASFASFVASTGSLLSIDRSLAPFIAVAVLVAEAAIVPLVAIVPIAGFSAATALLAAFTLAIARALRTGITAPCRCFGAGLTPISRQHLIRSTFLGGVAVLGIVASLTTSLWGRSELHVGGVAVAVLPAAVLAAFAIRLDDVIDLFAPISAAPDRRR